MMTHETAKDDKEHGVANIDDIALKTVPPESDDVNYDVRCGYGNCKPKGLQTCNNPKMLLFLLCLFAFVQGAVVNGINNINTQMYERRFKLTSSKSGLISSSYDFSAAVFGVIFSFLASGRYKGRWLAGGAACFGVGSFTMALPHFTTGLYDYGQGLVLNTCQPGRNSTLDSCTEDGLSNYLGVLMFGMILHGIGGCIMFAIGVSMLDDSVSTNKSPLFLGIFYAAAALGPGFGFITGAFLLGVYVDFDNVDTDTVSIQTIDPRWVGAWWVGFLITMTIALIIAVPLSMLGAELPTAKKVRETRVSQAHKGKADVSSKPGSQSSLQVKNVHKILWNLLSNPTFFFVMISGACEGMVIAGFGTFFSKFVQNKFGVSAEAAALYAGVTGVPGAVGGMILGGLICNKMKLKVRGMLKFSVIASFISIACANIFWLSCTGPPFAGINQKYDVGSEEISISSSCNTHCGCDTFYYHPVCSDTGVQYFSPCHAGCYGIRQDENKDLFYSLCTCSSTNNTSGEPMEMKGGICEAGCTNLIVFLVIYFVTILLIFLPATPTDAATLRCIPEEYRTFSLGIKWCCIKLLGTVPGPILFGAVTDSACKVWQKQCGVDVSCWIYDSAILSRNYFLISIVAKVISIGCFISAYCLYKPPIDKGEAITVHNAEISNEKGVNNKSFMEESFRHEESDLANMAEPHINAYNGPGQIMSYRF